ncbi:MAG TPA: hypothetical protein DCM62_02450 [Bacteroidales bacterium]|nr:hypothetical protein [Bacteroidales bacterium]
MEQIAPVIMLILWLIVSYLNNKKKPAAPQRTAPKPETTRIPRETDFQEMIEDLLGGDDDEQDETKKQPSKQYGGTKVPVGDPAKRREVIMQDTQDESDTILMETNDYEDTTDYNQHKELEEYKSLTYESEAPEVLSTGKNLPMLDYQKMLSNKSLESFEAMEVPIYDYEEMRSIAVEDEVIAETNNELQVRQFNLRDAIIYSEILNRKYK